MNLKNTMKTMLVALGVAHFASSTIAMDVEFTGLNPLQAKMRGSFYKGEVARLGGIAANPYPTVLAEKNDTHYLIKAFEAGDPEKFLKKMRTEIKTLLNTEIDAILGANNALIRGTVANGGGNQPADLTRNAFKTALGVEIDTFNDGKLGGIALPVDTKLANISAYKEAIVLAASGATSAWIDTLLALDGPFLDGAVAVGGGGNQPADHTRDVFKAILEATIQTY